MSGSEIAGFIVLSVVCGIVFTATNWFCDWDGCNDEDKKWKKDMIDRGLAQYNAKTGEWEWIEK